MKKMIILMVAFVCCLSASAELTALQVLQKMNNACNYEAGIKGKVTMKMMGMGGTVYFETNSKNSRVVDEDDITYYNGGTSYSYEKKSNTVTIAIDPSGDTFTLPFMLINLLLKEDVARNAFNDQEVQMKHKSGVYEIKFVDKINYIIDDKTFKLKTFTLKKGLMRLSFSYADLASLKDVQSLIYDKSKFPGAKVVDERKGKKAGPSLSEMMAKAIADTKKEAAAQSKAKQKK